jgi:BCCIP
VIQALTKYLLSTAGEHEADLRAVLSDDKHAGLLVHEQLLNLPIQIKPKLHDALREDIEWALQNEVSTSARYILFVLMCGNGDRAIAAILAVLRQ